MSIFLPARAARAARGSLGRSLVVAVAALLVVVVPISAVLVVVLTRNAEQGLKAGAERALSAQAQSTADRISAYVDERRDDLRVVAKSLNGSDLLGRQVKETLQHSASVFGGYQSVSVIDLQGFVVVQSTKDNGISATDGPGIDSNVRRTGSAMTISAPEGVLTWAVAQRVVDQDGLPIATVLGRLNLAKLNAMVHQGILGRTGRVIVVDHYGRELADSAIPQSATSAESLKHGILSFHAPTPATTAAIAGRTGAARFTSGRRRIDQFAGYAPIGSTGWGIVVAQHTSETLAAANHARSLATLILILGIVAAVIVGLLLALRALRPIKELRAAAVAVTGGDLAVSLHPRGTTEMRDTAVAFNSMVARLAVLSGQVSGASTEISAVAADMSAASEELATTATEQTAAATETSATMEELARTSASIAENVVAVAAKTTETREALAQADEDVRSSSMRTLALAERVDEIGIILELIHELANQTNLLALNAAIEAARAGEAGRGFSVVADEVRRLAERSKASAADITKIIAATQAETSASVLAMEKGGKQLTRGLELMDEVTEATDQVHLTTQQQRVATDQVVETMQSMTETTRNSAATTQQIAQSAAGLAQLSAGLQATANAASGHGDEPHLAVVVPVPAPIVVAEAPVAEPGDPAEPAVITQPPDPQRLAA